MTTNYYCICKQTTYKLCCRVHAAHKTPPPAQESRCSELDALIRSGDGPGQKAHRKQHMTHVQIDHHYGTVVKDGSNTCILVEDDPIIIHGKDSAESMFYKRCDGTFRSAEGQIMHLNTTPAILKVKADGSKERDWRAEEGRKR